VDVPLLIKQRLGELGLDQRDLAAAVQVGRVGNTPINIHELLQELS